MWCDIINTVGVMTQIQWVLDLSYSGCIVINTVGVMSYIVYIIAFSIRFPESLS